MWLRRLGLMAEARAHIDEPYAEPAPPKTITEASPFGAVTALRHPVGLSETPPYWARPPEPLGASAASWLPEDGG
jgi:hypothetical protein